MDVCLSVAQGLVEVALALIKASPTTIKKTIRLIILKYAPKLQIKFQPAKAEG